MSSCMNAEGLNTHQLGRACMRFRYALTAGSPVNGSQSCAQPGSQVCTLNCVHNRHWKVGWAARLECLAGDLAVVQLGRHGQVTRREVITTQPGTIAGEVTANGQGVKTCSDIWCRGG